jgi:DNA-binding GntR family transcriptional regulator
MPTALATVPIVDLLRNRIVSGSLPPGAPLRQEALAADLGVSRIPVRDALAQLSAEGLVALAASGARVTTVTDTECAEVFDLRVLVEGDLLAHAVPRHTPRTLRRLAAVQLELEHTDDAAGWVAGDRDFHEALYEPAGRTWTLDTVRRLRNVVERFAVLHLSHDVRRSAWRDEHRSLLEAVGAGDVVLARDRLSAHLRGTEGIVRAALGELHASTRPA